MKNLNQINTAGKTSNRMNPLMGKPEKEVVSKTVRIYESSHKKAREMAFKEDMPIVEIIKEALEMLYESKKYDK